MTPAAVAGQHGKAPGMLAASLTVSRLAGKAGEQAEEREVVAKRRRYVRVVTIVAEMFAELRTREAAT